MKALLVLVSVLGAMASGTSPPLLDSFAAGIVESPSGPLFCASHPWECGETLGHLLQLLSPSPRTSKFPCINCFGDLLSGFVNGLIQDAGTVTSCRLDLERVAYEFVALYPYFLDVMDSATARWTLGDLTSITCSSTAVLFTTLNSDCGFSTLIYNILNIDFDWLSSQYQLNFCTVNQATTALALHGSDFYQAGKASGTLFKVFTNWGI